MPKILHIITGLNDGGAEGVLFRLCTSTSNDTKHIVVSMMDAGKYGPMLSEKGITVYTLLCRPGISVILAIPKISRIIRMSKPDIVQTWMYHANLIGGIAAFFSGNKKIVWGIRHTNLESNKKTTQWISFLSARLSGIIPSAIICCSDRSAQVHREYGYNKKMISVIYNGYNLDAFKPSSEARLKIRNELNIPEDLLLFGMVGRWDPQKDHVNLLQALSIFKQFNPNFKCLLVGPKMTYENKKLMDIIKHENLQDHICLLGRRTDVPAIMNALDVHVLSSMYGEAFPNVVAEAMACGTPCVSTDVGDAALIVGNPDWVVPTKRPDLLAEAISKVLSSIKIEGRENVGSRCRQRISEKFSLDRMLASFTLLWNSIAEK